MIQPFGFSSGGAMTVSHPKPIILEEIVAAIVFAISASVLWSAGGYTAGMLCVVKVEPADLTTVQIRWFAVWAAWGLASGFLAYVFYKCRSPIEFCVRLPGDHTTLAHRVTRRFVLLLGCIVGGLLAF